MAIDLNDVQTRLRGLDIFVSVSDMAGAADAMENGARPPAAFVGVASESAAPNRTQGVHDQKVDAVISVVLCLAAQRADGRRSDEVEAARAAVINALSGWTPTGARGAFDFVGYRIVAMGGGLIWPEMSFRAPWVLRL